MPSSVDGARGSSVEALRPPEFTSRSATGKTSGGIALAGWRAVRMIERFARAPICVGRALIVRAVDRNGIDVADLELRAPTLDDVFLAKTGRTLEGAAEEVAERPTKRRR